MTHIIDQTWIRPTDRWRSTVMSTKLYPCRRSASELGRASWSVSGLVQLSERVLRSGMSRLARSNFRVQVLDSSKVVLPTRVPWNRLVPTRWWKWDWKQNSFANLTSTWIWSMDGIFLCVPFGLTFSSVCFITTSVGTFVTLSQVAWISCFHSGARGVRGVKGEGRGNDIPFANSILGLLCRLLSSRRRTSTSRRTGWPALGCNCKKRCARCNYAPPPPTPPTPHPRIGEVVRVRPAGSWRRRRRRMPVAAETVDRLLRESVYLFRARFRGKTIQ